MQNFISKVADKLKPNKKGAVAGGGMVLGLITAILSVSILAAFTMITLSKMKDVTTDAAVDTLLNDSVTEVGNISDYYGLWILAGGIAFTVVLFAVVFLVFRGISGERGA